MFNQGNKSLYSLEKLKDIISLLNESSTFLANLYNQSLNNCSDYNFTISLVDSILHYIDNYFETKLKTIIDNIKDLKYSFDNKNKTKIKNKSKDKDKDKDKDKSKELKKNFSYIDFEKDEEYTSKDIQNLNKNIIIEFTQFSTDFIKDDDEIENQTLGTKLFQIANISRNAYNDSDKILSYLYKDFEKEMEKDKEKPLIISSLDQFRKNFSCWVKNQVTGQKAKQYIDNFSKQFNPNYINEEKTKIKTYFTKLYKELLNLYFICKLSFPSVEIDFNLKDENYNNKTMIDNFPSSLKYKPKVNFVYFPSLYSNGNYLDNAKQWVFTYINTNKKNTFHVDNKYLIPLIEDKNRFKIPKVSDIIKLELKKEILYTTNMNYKISDDVNKELLIYTSNKNTNQTNKFRINKSSFKLLENEEINKMELYLYNELIYSKDFKKV